MNILDILSRAMNFWAYQSAQETSLSHDTSLHSNPSFSSLSTGILQLLRLDNTMNTTPEDYKTNTRPFTNNTTPQSATRPPKSIVPPRLPLPIASSRNSLPILQPLRCHSSGFVL